MYVCTHGYIDRERERDRDGDVPQHACKCAWYCYVCSQSVQQSVSQLCLYVRIYIGMYVCMFVCSYVQLGVRLSTSLCMCMHTCILFSLQADVHACQYVYACACAYCKLIGYDSYTSTTLYAYVCDYDYGCAHVCVRVDVYAKRHKELMY